MQGAPLRLASIDIGSNAVRLFVGQQLKSGQVKVLTDQRASVRLGKDAFSAGYIRANTQADLEKALMDFRKICDQLHVKRIRAVGTSALRDSLNHRKVLENLKNRTGIRVQIIDGQKEAILLHKAVSHTLNLSQKSALLMDIGGGSLEVILSRRGRVQTVRSLPMGTVRLLNRLSNQPTYEEIARFVRTPLYRLRFDVLGEKQNLVSLLVGTGGNIRALARLCFRLSLSRSKTRFHRHHLEALVLRLFEMNLTQRMKRFQLKRDRADVILPAAVVTLELMRIFEISEMMAPNVGLKNGLFWESIERTGRA